MKKIIFFIVLANFTFAQNLDSLYNTIFSIHSPDNSNSKTNIITNDSHYHKCGFSLIADIKLHFDKFTTAQQNTIQQLLERPTRQKSIVSPAGLFRIHYDTTGSRTPDYLEGIQNTANLSAYELAVAFDSSYNYEVNILGYTPPPSDGTDGGDDLYDVYIGGLDGSTYGETNWESIGNNKNKSYIIVDNRMNFYTKGVAAASVTAAHEFHHAIQTGTYTDNTNGNKYYFELTSTSMEEFVYGDVNDYHGYLHTYFNDPDRRFTLFNGYGLAIWNIFLKEKFEQHESNSKKGFEIIKRTWELMRDEEMSALQAIKKALAENGLSFKSTFAEFAQWTYFTNHRAKPGSYFSEASEYPLIKPFFPKYKFDTSSKSYYMKSAPMSNNFMEFDVSNFNKHNTLVSIITNCDIVSADNATNNPRTNYEIDYKYSISVEDGKLKIANKYFTTLESDGIQYLNESIILDNLIVYGNTVTLKNIDYAYPQPFNREKHNYLFLPTTLSKIGVAKLSIYNINMDLVYNAELPIPEYGEKITVRWDGRDNTGKSVASGIYIFITESDGVIKQGKIAIINN